MGGFICRVFLVALVCVDREERKGAGDTRGQGRWSVGKLSVALPGPSRRLVSNKLIYSVLLALPLTTTKGRLPFCLPERSVSRFVYHLGLSCGIAPLYFTLPINLIQTLLQSPAESRGY